MVGPRPNAQMAFQRPAAAVAPATQLQSQGLEEPEPQLARGQSGQLGLLPFTYIY